MRATTMIVLLALADLSACRDSSSSRLPIGVGGSSAAVVETIIPADGSRDVATDQLVAVVFSVDMDPKSFDRESFSVRRDGEAVEGVVAALGRRATFRPEPGLEEGGSYEVVLTTDIRDGTGRRLASERRFRFETEPLGPFKIAKIVPGTDARSVALGASIVVAFTRAVDPASLREDSVRLSQATAPIIGRLSIVEEVVTFQPDRSLDFETVYDVIVVDSIRARDGAPLTAGRRWSFTTVQRFLPPPVVDPEDGASEIGLPFTVKATFDRGLDPSSVTEDSFYLLNTNGERVTASVSVDDLQAFLEPAAEELFFDVPYTAVITRDVRGAGFGESLAEDFAWQFTTERLGPHRAVFVGANTPVNAVAVFLERPGQEMQAHPDSPFPTGGASGGDVLDGVALSAAGDHLFVVNAISRDVASLRVGEAAGLTPAPGSPFSVSGVPLAIEAHPDWPFVFVATADSEATRLESFELNVDGSLRSLSAPLELAEGIPAQLLAAPIGNRLFVTYRNLGRVDVYAIAVDGGLVLLKANSVPVLGSTGAASGVDGRTLFLLDEDPGAQELWAYTITGGGELSPHEEAPFDTAPASGLRTALFLRSDRKVFVGHQSGHISTFDFDADGTFVPNTGSPFQLPDLRPRQLAGLDNGPDLYLLEDSPSQLRRFAIEPNGTLTVKGEPFVIPGASELSGLAIRDRIGFAQDLVLHLPFDGDLTDVSGRGHDAPALEDPTFGAGRIGLGIVFDGSRQFLVLGFDDDFRFGVETDFTVSFWLRTSQTIRDASFLSNKDWASGSNRGWILAAQDDSLHWQWNLRGADQGRIDFEDGGLITDDAWHHLVVTHDRDGVASFYQDGAILDSILIRGSGDIDSGLPLLIGQDGTGEYEFALVGTLDDLALWRRVLDANEIARLWQLGQNGKSF